MWTKRRSFLILVRIHHKGLKKLTIPIPIAILEETIQALIDLLWLPELIYQGWHTKLTKSMADKWRAGNLPSSLSPVHLLELCQDIIGELRKYGRWQMVGVEQESNKVSVDFY